MKSNCFHALSAIFPVIVLLLIDSISGHSFPFISGRSDLPIPTGPYRNVGYLDLMTGTDENNGVFVRILYPAMNQTIDPRAKYEEWPKWITPDYREAMVNLVKPIKLDSPLLFHGVNKLIMDDPHIPILWNVEPMKMNNKTFPVIIHSHGLCSTRFLSSHINYQLVSYGFVVFMIEHRDRSAILTYYPNKNNSQMLIRLDLKPFDQYDDELEARQQQLSKRVQEIEILVHLIEDIQKGKAVKNVLEPQFDSQRFSGMFDLSKIIMSGHSFGGATTIRSLAKISTLKIGIPLDAWMVPLRNFSGLSLINKPLLFVNMEDFQTKRNIRIMRRYLAPNGNNTFNRRSVTIRDATHFDVNDLPMILTPTAKRILEFYLADHTMTQSLSIAFMLEFISDQLKIEIKNDKKDLIKKLQKLYWEGLQMDDPKEEIHDWDSSHFHKESVLMKIFKNTISSNIR